MNREDIIRTIELLEASLKVKWNKNSCALISDCCPFCYDAREKRDKSYTLKDVCDLCLCPKSICGFHGVEGYICELYTKYSFIRICDMDSEDLNHMRNLFDDEIKKYEEMLEEMKK